MDVAIIATISAGIVTVVGILVNGYIARQQRLQAIELAEKAHTHERDLARGDRLYARRAPVYEQMIASVHAVMEHVEATEPIASFGGEPELPPQPSLDDQRAMQAKLRTHGSKAVADALDEFTKHARSFQMHAFTFRRVRNQQQDIQDLLTQMNDERQQARDAEKRLEGLVSDELAAL